MTRTYLSNALLFTLLFFLVSLAAQQTEGIASFYGDEFDGNKTSTGEVFRQNGYMAASKELDWGTIVEVTNLSNGKKVQVRINDCGPNVRGRIIDLSRRAAQELDFVKKGETKVRLRVVRASNAGPNCERWGWSKKLKATGKPVPPKPGPWKPSDTAHLTQEAPAVAAVPDVPLVPPAPPTTMRGFASYYADRFEGKYTNTGEVYSGAAFTAASKAYPYNTVLEVTDVTSGRKVNVRVNDCGPHDPDRLLDLSRAAADRIGLRRAGTAAVTVRIIELGTDGPTCERAAWVENIKQNQAADRVATAGGQVLAAAPSVPDLPARATVTPAEGQAGPGTYGNAARLSPAPASPPTGMPAEKAYRVQLGAFRNEASAYTIYDELVAKSYVDALVYKNPDNGLFTTVLQTAYDKAAAEAVRQQAVADGFKNAVFKEVRESPATIRRTAQSKKTDLPAAVNTAGPVTYGGAVAAPAAPPVTQPAPPEFPPDVILFGVQVGAYSTAAGVKELRDKLAADGVGPVYDADVGKMTRVFAGKFYFQSQARELRDELREKGYTGATVRRVQ